MSSFTPPSSIPGVDKEAERSIVKHFTAIGAVLTRLLRFPDSTTELRRVATIAQVGQLLRLSPPAEGLPVQLPLGSQENKGEVVRLAVDSVASGGSVFVTAVGRQPINGAELVTLVAAGLVEFRSLGTDGWAMDMGGTAQQAWPVGSIFMSANATNPATLLGFGTWTAFGTGRMPVAFDSGQTEFDTLLETGGSKTNTPTGTVSAPVFTGSSANTSLVSAGTPSGTNGAPIFTGSATSTTLDSAGTPAGSVSAPTFTGTPFTQVINHTHAVTINDPGHVHGLPEGQTDGDGSLVDKSNAADNSPAVPTDSATTGITATTANPAGGVTSITPAGTNSTPTFTGSALGTHSHQHTPLGSVSAPSFTGNAMGTHQHTLTATGTNSVPTFTGASGNNLPPYIVVSMWQRTA